MTQRQRQMFVSLMAGLALVAVSTMAYAQSSGPDSASSAMGQLQNATSGTQSTGQTFDGGNTPTDAYPNH